MSLFKFDEELTKNNSEEFLDLGDYNENKKVLTDQELHGSCEEVCIDSDLFKNQCSKNFKNCGPQDFELMSVLGKGGYGKVYLARKCTGPNKGELYAMKVLKKAVIYKNSKNIAHTKSERRILETIKHPFIVDLMYAFQTKNKLYLIMEYLSGGELFMQLERNGSLPENVARFYIAEIILAISHLHDKGIIYRDLKPENIMLTDKGHVKLTDFGLSKEYIYPGHMTNTFCGTIEYMAPEMITKTGHGIPADWWSVGAVLYDMLVGHPPFYNPSRQKTINLILKGKLVFHHFLSYEAKDIIYRFLIREPSFRLGCDINGTSSIYNHPFFASINWLQLFNCQVQPPYIPPIHSPSDTCMFDTHFTSMPAIETPCTESDSYIDDAFIGFTYVAPSLMYDGSSSSSPNKSIINRTKSCDYLDEM